MASVHSRHPCAVYLPNIPLIKLHRWAPGRTTAMATAGLGFLSSPWSSSQLCCNSRFSSLFRKASPLSPKASRLSAAKTLTSAFADHKPDRFIDDKKVIIRTNILACPICYNRFIWNHEPQPSMYSLSQSTLECNTCQKTYYGNDTHIDLTISSGGKAYGETMAASTEIFRVPFISFLYERGWRQSFSLWGGFPGPEKEVS